MRSIENLLTRIKEAKFLDENKKLILDYDKELVANKNKNETRTHYLVALEKLAKLFPKKSFKKMDKRHLVELFANLKPNAERVLKNGNIIKLTENKTYSPQTIAIYQICVKRFFKWLYGLDDDDGYPEPVKWMKVTKKERFKLPEELITEEELEKILKVCDHPRDRAMISMLAETGMRSGEATSIFLKHLQRDEYGTTVIVNGKTGQRKLRLLNSIPELNMWLSVHPFKDNPDAPLFISYSKKFYGKQLGRDGLYLTLRRLLRRAGLKKRIHPHLFRHTALTRFAKMGFRESELKILAGWSGVSRMPQVYIHLSGEDVDKKFLELNGVLSKEEIKKIRIKETKFKPRICPRCKEQNLFDAKFCNKCWLPLDVKTSSDVKQRIDALVNEILALKDVGATDELIEKAKEKRLNREYVETIVKTTGY